MKNIIKNIKLGICLSIVAFTFSCSSTDDGTPSYNPNPNNPDLPANVSYSCHIKPIIDANCVGCHSKYSDVSKIKNDIDKIKNAIILPSNSADVMPTTGRMDQYSIDMIYKWNLQGMVENGTCSTTSGGVVSYTTDIKPLIATTCLGCHGPSSSRPLPYTTYDQVRSSFTSIANATTSNYMPQASPWSSVQKALFAKWKADGYIQ